MRALNAEHRGLDEVTDVLAFPLDGLDELPPGLERQLGDVVVCFAQAARQAAEAGVETLAEVRTLVVHGLLHLLGHDHESDAGEMLARQDELSAVLPRSVTPASQLRHGHVTRRAPSVAACSPCPARPRPFRSAAACGPRARRSSRGRHGPLAAVDLADGRALLGRTGSRAGWVVASPGGEHGCAARRCRRARARRFRARAGAAPAPRHGARARGRARRGGGRAGDGILARALAGGRARHGAPRARARACCGGARGGRAPRRPPRRRAAPSPAPAPPPARAAGRRRRAPPAAAAAAAPPPAPPPLPELPSAPAL